MLTGVRCLMPSRMPVARTLANTLADSMFTGSAAIPRASQSHNASRALAGMPTRWNHCSVLRSARSAGWRSACQPSSTVARAARNRSSQSRSGCTPSRVRMASGPLVDMVTLRPSAQRRVDDFGNATCCRVPTLVR